MKNYKEIVLELLEEKPITRKDDYILYGFVLKRLGYSLDITLREFLQNQKKLKMPSFKSIERSRRDIQAERTDLIDIPTFNVRYDEEKNYHEKYGGKK